MAIQENFRTLQDLVKFHENGSGFPLGDMLVAIDLEQSDSILTDHFFSTLEQMSWAPETRVNSQIGVSIASAFFGKHLQGRDEITNHANLMLELSGLPPIDPNNPKDNVVDSSGFTELYQVLPGLTADQYFLLQQVVCRELFVQSTSGLNQRAQDVGLVVFSTSIPLSPSQSRNIASVCGIPDDVAVITNWEACASTAAGIKRVINGEHDHLISDETTTVTFISIDDQNKYSERGGDQNSPRLFSSAASVTSLRYSKKDNENHGSFTPLVTIEEDNDRVGPLLKIMTPQTDWAGNLPDNLYQVPNLVTADDGKLIDMRPRAGLVFAIDGAEVGIKTINEYAAKFHNGDVQKAVDSIKRVIIHHPNKLVFDSLGSRVEKATGIDTGKMSWVIHEGNSPVNTIPIAFSRQMDDLNPDDTVMILAFGAGGKYIGIVAKLNQAA